MYMDYKKTHRSLLWGKRLTVMYIYNNLEGDHCIIMFNSHLTFQFKFRFLERAQIFRKQMIVGNKRKEIQNSSLWEPNDLTTFLQIYRTHFCTSPPVTRRHLQSSSTNTKTSNTLAVIGTASTILLFILGLPSAYSVTCPLTSAINRCDDRLQEQSCEHGTKLKA